MPNQNAGSQVVGAANRSLSRGLPLTLRSATGAKVGPVVVRSKSILAAKQHRNGVTVTVDVEPLEGCVGLPPLRGAQFASLHLGDYVSARVGGPGGHR